MPKDFHSESATQATEAARHRRLFELLNTRNPTGTPAAARAAVLSEPGPTIGEFAEMARASIAPVQRGFFGGRYRNAG